MPEFDPESPVIVEKTSDIGSMRRYTFEAGRFESVEEIKEYLEMIASSGSDIGYYDIRQPVSTIEVEVENEVPYTEKELDWVHEAQNSFESVYGVIDTANLDETSFENQVSRPPYDINATYKNCDFSVTVNADEYDFDAVEEDLVNQVHLSNELFFEGKTENFKRGEREPATYTVYFSLDRMQSQIPKHRHLYHKLKSKAKNVETVTDVVMAEYLHIGTTQSYVLGEPYPDDTILIDIRNLTGETSFMNDVVFTKEKTEQEAFEEVRPTLEEYTEESKQVYGNHFAGIVSSLPYDVEIVGAGEYSSGTTTRLVLGLRPE